LSCETGIVPDGFAARPASRADMLSFQPAINCLSVAGAPMFARDKSTTCASFCTTRPTNARPFCSNMPSL
jgi:hypothetical protein